MTDNPTSTPSANEPDDSTRVFTPGSGAQFTGDSPSQSVPPASSQSSAPTWRSTTSASSASSSASASDPASSWRGVPSQTPGSAASAPAAPSSAASASWAGQQPQQAQQWNPPQPQQQNPGQQQGQQVPPQAAPYAQVPYAASQAQAKSGHKDGLRALFDLSFTDQVTPLLVKILYVVSFVIAVLWWLSAILVGAGIASMDSGYGYGSRGSSSGSGVMVVLAILFGWIPGAIGILITRVLCEFALAGLKTQRAAEDILKHLDSE